MIRRWLLGPIFAAAAAFFISAGCERKEKLLDIETPRTDVEVERNEDTGEVDVEVERKDDQ